MVKRRNRKKTKLPWRRVRLRGEYVVCAMVLAVGLGGYAWRQLEGHAASTCGQVSGPFSVSGANVLQANGKPYVAYGVTSPGLAHSDYQTRIADDEAQIRAAASSWCSNTVRLQVSQDNLVGANGTTYSQSFMDAIGTEVTLAKQLGLMVVINAQTQDVGLEPGPTFATEAFWRAIITQYGNDPKVVFDVFNEPRIGTGSTAGNWQIWQKGGTSGGVSYLGMQQVVSDIRSHGANNLIWLEGPGTSSDLNLALSYPVTGGPIEYAIHHPDGGHNTATWDSDFGYLVNENKAPVTEGEWSNYASTKSECWADAPTAVPAFLKYLTTKHIGLNVWTLQQGVMIESADKSDPTVIKSDWSCTDGLNEGAGRLVMNFFISQNSVISTPAPTPTSAPTKTVPPMPGSGSQASQSTPGAQNSQTSSNSSAAKSTSSPAAGSSSGSGGVGGSGQAQTSAGTGVSSVTAAAGHAIGGAVKRSETDALAVIGVKKPSTIARMLVLLLVVGLTALAGWYVYRRRSQGPPGSNK